MVLAGFGDQQQPWAAGRAMESAAQCPQGIIIHLFHPRAAVTLILPSTHKIKDLAFIYKEDFIWSAMSTYSQSQASLVMKCRDCLCLCDKVDQLHSWPGFQVGTGLELNYLGRGPDESRGAARPQGREMLWDRRVKSILASGNPWCSDQWRTFWFLLFWKRWKNVHKNYEVRQWNMCLGVQNTQSISSIHNDVLM